MTQQPAPASTFTPRPPNNRLPDGAGLALRVRLVEAANGKTKEDRTAAADKAMAIVNRLAKGWRYRESRPGEQIGLQLLQEAEALGYPKEVADLHNIYLAERVARSSASAAGTRRRANRQARELATLVERTSRVVGVLTLALEESKPLGDKRDWRELLLGKNLGNTTIATIHPVVTNLITAKLEDFVASGQEIAGRSARPPQGRTTNRALGLGPRL